MLLRHVIPNSLAPVIVVATVSLGTFIVAEATLSFLGIGLPPSALSPGARHRHRPDVDPHATRRRSSGRRPPCRITVLAFLLLGDVVRDALDPKARARR